MTVDGARLPNPAHRDRTGGLIFFGIVQFVFGLLSGAMTVMLVLAMALMSAEDTATVQTPIGQMIVALALYAAIAAWFFAMGIGSMLGRRWARALTVATCGIWFAFGLAGLLASVFFIPSIYRQLADAGQLPEAMVEPMSAFVVVLMAGLGVGVPLIFVLFYSSPHVRATCEAKDPKPRWTDGCPTPVLALSIICLWFGFSSCTLGVYGFTIPFFGIFAKGAIGALIVLVNCLALVYAAWGLCKMKSSAWWLAFLILLGWGISIAFTFARSGLMDYYRAMDIPATQLRAIETLAPLSRTLSIYYALWYAALLAYVIYTKKYFRAESVATDTN